MKDEILPSQSWSDKRWGLVILPDGATLAPLTQPVLSSAGGHYLIICLPPDYSVVKPDVTSPCTMPSLIADTVETCAQLITTRRESTP